MEQDSAIGDLRREVAGLRFGIFLGIVVILALLTLANLFSITFIPRYEKIFEDMLGSTSKLPELTKWIIGYGRAGNGLLPYALVFSCFALGVAIMNWMRKSWTFILVGIVTFLLLGLHMIVLNLACNMPLIQIIQGINEKSV